MLRYLARRLAAMVPLVLGTILLVFVLGRLAPGDPVQILFGDLGDAASVARARAQLGLDRPLAEQHVRFLARLGHLDPGVSYAYPGKPVSALLASAVSTSLLLGILAVATALVLGMPIGIAAALAPRTCIDRLARAVTLLGIAVPFFVIAAGLVLLFSLPRPPLRAGRSYHRCDRSATRGASRHTAAALLRALGRLIIGLRSHDAATTGASTRGDPCVRTV